MPDIPLVSVIVAVRNGERFLAAALESIYAQDYRSFEVIVVDGQSTDNTAAIAQSFARVQYIWQMGQGIADAYNLGLAAAQGSLIAFLSHDDLWTPDKLRMQVGYMQSHPNILYTIARVHFFLEPGHQPPPGFRCNLLDGDHVGRIMETLVARRAVFDMVGPFDTTIAIANDADWFARAQDMAIPMAVLPQVLLHKRIHATNLSLHTAANTRDLLVALRRSAARKQAHQCSTNEE